MLHTDLIAPIPELLRRHTKTRGDKIAYRDAHSSVTAAMVHGGFQPVYLPAIYDRELGVSLGPTRAAVHDLLAREHVDCVFITSPSRFVQ